MNEGKPFSWKVLMKPANEDQPIMRTPALVGLVAGLHVLAVGTFLLIQGCSTVQPGAETRERRTPTRTTARVEPPPPPVMPPRAAPAPRVEVPRPAVRPPTPVEPTLLPGESKAYTVQRGDTLSKIASQHGVTTRELAAFNNISDPNTLRVGQQINVPLVGVAPRAPAPTPAATPAVDLSRAEQVYVVQSGDSLSRIASRYGVTVAQLREANALTGDLIRIGQRLAIPSGGRPAARTEPEPSPEPVAPVTVREPTTPTEERPEPAAPTAPAPADDDAISGFAQQPITYTVLEGDTIDIIAKLFIVSKEDILTLNNLEPGAVLEKGQRIQIPPSAL